jgi:hypothetical protein
MFSRPLYPFLWLALCLAAVAWLVAAGVAVAEPAANASSPVGGRHELTLRLRYPDGRAASGVGMSLVRLPDRDVVGWQFTDNVCRSDERGECRWSVWSGLYEFVFEEGIEPDAVTLAAAGSQGLHGLGVYLDQDFTVGLVLADPLTGGAGETLFFDQSPEAALPVYRVPSLEDLHHHEDAAEEQRATAATEASDGDEIAVGSEIGVDSRGTSWPLLAAAVCLAGGGIFFYHRSLAPPTTAVATPDKTDSPQTEE